MTNYQDLAQTWQALSGLAPELFLPITDDQSLEQATAALRALDREMSASPVRPHPLAELADTAMRRILAYEAEHSPIPDADGPMMLEFYLDQKNLTQQQVSAATGIHQATISQLLNRKRAFAADHARALGAFFGVSPAMFL